MVSVKAEQAHGPALPHCLPGEPQECGRTAQQHVLAWSAAVKAAAHHLIEQASPTPARAAHVAGPLYQRRLAELRAHDAPAADASTTQHEGPYLTG